VSYSEKSLFGVGDSQGMNTAENMAKFRLNTSVFQSVVSNSNLDKTINEEPQNEGDLRKKFRLMCSTPRRLLVRFYTKAPKDEEDYDPLKFLPAGEPNTSDISIFDWLKNQEGAMNVLCA